jgi:hypothetical protein
MVRRGSGWCGVAQDGAAWLRMVQHGSVMVRRGSVWCSMAQLWCGVAQDGAAWLSYGAAWLSMVRRGSVWSHGAAWLSRCGVAQLVARRLALRQARVRFSARHHMEIFPSELTSDEEMERGPGEWRRINVHIV